MTSSGLQSLNTFEMRSHRQNGCSSRLAPMVRWQSIPKMHSIDWPRGSRRRRPPDMMFGRLIDCFSLRHNESKSMVKDGFDCQPNWRNSPASSAIRSCSASKIISNFGMPGVGTIICTSSKIATTKLLKTRFRPVPDGREQSHYASTPRSVNCLISMRAGEFAPRVVCVMTRPLATGRVVDYANLLPRRKRVATRDWPPHDWR